jgi:hypothetical protein
MAMYWAIIGVLADSDMPGTLEICKTAGKDAGKEGRTYPIFAFLRECHHPPICLNLNADRLKLLLP